MARQRTPGCRHVDERPQNATTASDHRGDPRVHPHFDRIAEASNTTRELYDEMLALRAYRVNRGALWGTARAWKVMEASHVPADLPYRA